MAKRIPAHDVLPGRTGTSSRPGRIVLTALLVTLATACGTQTVQAPDPPEAAVGDVPAEQDQTRRTACTDVAHIVLRRTEQQLPDCRKSARGGYPGATERP